MHPTAGTYFSGIDSSYAQQSPEVADDQNGFAGVAGEINPGHNEPVPWATVSTSFRRRNTIPQNLSRNALKKQSESATALMNK